jgi:hypothetical protein
LLEKKTVLLTDKEIMKKYNNIVLEILEYRRDVIEIYEHFSFKKDKDKLLMSFSILNNLWLLIDGKIPYHYVYLDASSSVFQIHMLHNAIYDERL